MAKVRIAVEEVIAIQNRLSEINRLDIQDIEWTRGGEVIPYTEKQVNAFDYTGLLNTDFIWLYGIGENKCEEVKE